MQLFRTPRMPFRRLSMFNGRFVPRNGPQKSARSEFVQACTLVQQKNAEAITSGRRSIGRRACSLRDMVIKPSSHGQLRNWCATACRLGCHYLILASTASKDVFRPERVFQVCVSDLPAEFPPLRLLDARLTNLLAQPTTFIGRERELAAVLALLRRDNVRLITLTGPGGTGKTRLSIQAAANVLDEYKHGVFFVSLATITDPDLVIPTIGAIFNLKDLGGQPVGELLKYHLAERHLLLVLDNLEQVISAGPKIAELLSTAPRLRILVTSREKLHVYGEHEHPVPPLALPDMMKSPALAVLSQSEAVALFIQRAEAANPKFQITEATAPAVAEICVRLDGLPLAIELAAARSKPLTPDAMLARLSSRLKALTGGARDLPPRQQTIRGAIDWSYDLLDDGEKTLFARLGFLSAAGPMKRQRRCAATGCRWRSSTAWNRSPTRA